MNHFNDDTIHAASFIHDRCRMYYAQGWRKSPTLASAHFSLVIGKRCRFYSIKRVVGKRSEQPIAFNASAELMLKGIRFNEEIHRLSPNTGFPRKGVIHFKSHAESNQYDDECVSRFMAALDLS